MRRIKIQIVISLIIYSVSYLVKTFVLFEFTNPFEWILMIPKLTPWDRGVLLTALAMYYATCYVCILMYEENKNNE